MLVNRCLYFPFFPLWINLILFFILLKSLIISTMMKLAGNLQYNRMLALTRQRGRFYCGPRSWSSSACQGFVGSSKHLIRSLSDWPSQGGWCLSRESTDPGRWDKTRYQLHYNFETWKKKLLSSLIWVPATYRVFNIFQGGRKGVDELVGKLRQEADGVHVQHGHVTG